MMTRRICMCGAQGVGKSTLARRYVERNAQCDVIDNVCRNLSKTRNVALNTHGNDASQTIVFDAMCDALTSHTSSYVSARSIVDVMAYTYALMRRNHITRREIVRHEQRFESFINEHRDDFVYVYVPIEFACEHDNVRDVDESYRREIDDTIRSLLKLYEIDHVIVHGNVDERVAQIEAYVYQIEQNKQKQKQRKTSSIAC